MSEFDDRLRTAIRAVGDHAQVADLLDRSLRTSRVLRRRRAAAAVTAAAVVVGGIGIGGWAISTHSNRDGFSQVVTIPSSPAPTRSTPPPSSPAPPSLSPAPAPSASSSVQPTSPSAIASATPTALTLVALPVVECPTQYGIANPGPPGAVKSVTVSGDVASSLANYTDGLHYMSVVGPRGWHCSAIDAADGNAFLFIAPPGASSTPVGTGYRRDTREGIGATSGGSAQIPFEFTCAAMPDLGVSGGIEQCTKVPAGEQFTRINHTTADFIDPPGVAGIGTPSGGRYTARGQIRYSPPPIPTMGDGAAEVTCTLPASDASLCQTIINGFRPWVDPIGDPDAIQQCFRHVASQNAALAVVAGFDTTVGAANRYLDLVSGTPSQPPAVEHDAKHTSTTRASLCVFDGSFNVPGFVATRAYMIVGTDGTPLYPSVFNDQTSTPTRPAP
jgi:hypothetical protein